ncbi:MAG: HAD-IC family P-type ATPase [bacterium]
MFQNNWHEISVPDVYKKLKSTSRGLESAQVNRRRNIHGYNVLPTQPSRTGREIIGRQFSSPLILILVAASVISFALGDLIDGQVILAAVLLNVVVGFIQEFRAEKTMEALRRVITFKALVIRQGVERLISSTQIVPGDVLVLRAGARVIVDARVTRAINLKANESTLTGEAYPVNKQIKKVPGQQPLADRTNMIYSGTTIVSGEGQAVVVATGAETEFGKIAISVKGVKEKPTPWQLRLNSFSRYLTLIVIGISAALFVVGVLTGRSMPEMFAVSVAVAVAAIPEGLAIGVTVVLVIGMRRILKKHALTRQLIAVETLGSTTVLCVDKTGTLTEGNMAVTRIVTNNHDLNTSSEELHRQAQEASQVSAITLLKIGLLCNDAHVEDEDEPLEHRKLSGEPTEKALVTAAHIVGFTKKATESLEPRVSTLPFNSNNKYMVTGHKQGSGLMFYAKGAPEVILDATVSVDIDGKVRDLTPKWKSELFKRAEQISRQGLRVLAFGYAAETDQTKTELTELPKLTFVGFAGIKDPLRKESQHTIATLQRAGITVAMITGDHRLTAKAIAKELGLPVDKDRIITGLELSKISDKELQKRIRQISVYARVSAEDKIRIVKAWQAKGEVVAMTGDGINDAAALKAADIGIALGSGTDVAKEASKIVLLDNNVKTIESAVEQGRIIFANIKKVTLYLLSDSFSQVALVVSSLIMGLPLPLTAAQILWINLITDGLPNIALTVEPKETDVMSEPPRPKTESLLDKPGKWLVMFVSMLTGILSFLLFLYVYNQTADVVLARSIAYTSLGMTTLFYVFSIRYTKKSILFTNPFNNGWLVVAVAAGLFLQIIVLYVPALQSFLGTTGLGLEHWKLILYVIVLVIAAIEAMKFLMRPKIKTRATT